MVATSARFPQEPIRQCMKLDRLIDGDRLVSLFEKVELGLKPKTVYELVPEFFRSFES
jgi:hypothetical protein